jgi:hypothetical protein
MAWLKSATHYVLISGALYLILAYLADLPMRQSIVLALVLAPLARKIASPTPKPAARFRPYRVSVSPDWYQLLTDFHLIDNPEEWGVHDRIARTCPPKFLEALPANEYRVLRDGIFFTVLQQSEDFQEPGLIYWNGLHVFKSKPVFRGTMEPITKADFFVATSGDGYNLGIIVPYWWWNEVKASCPTPVTEARDVFPEKVALTLATIPYLWLDLHYGNRQKNVEPLERPSRPLEELSQTLFYKYMGQLSDRIPQRDDQLKKLGWKADGRWPQEDISHRYFWVSRREI